MIAVKFMEDGNLRNSDQSEQEGVQNNLFFSKVGGISLEQLNELESQFLLDIKYSLLVSPELYQKYER